ncbi:imelysin family protein [Marivita sp. S0852]|uniref:imelysin family protein n=1 Tax=Marivita sp. S0852 TaxID=3373893 RepID=UPI003982CF97
MRLAVAFCLLASPALSDVSNALDKHILPAYGKLAEATQMLADVAQADCTPSAVIPAYHTAYDAWIAASHIQVGPIEDQGLAIALAFWPDPKDRTAKALARLTSAQDPVVDDASAFVEVSAAAQGFTALERVLFDPQPNRDYACRLTRAITVGLANKAVALNTAWPEFAALMRLAGADGNTRFQSPEETQRTLYTALSTGLEFLHDQRLGRPLGSYDRPRPTRAEARRSDRSLRHIQLSLAALEDLAVTMTDGDLTQTRAAFAEARARAAELNDPALAGVANPAKRIRVEALQRTVRDIQNAINSEIGTPLGITAGFNSLDGD